MNWRDIKILMVEDDPNYIEFIADLISQSRTGIRHIRHATTVRRALEFLDSERFDVALLDLHLPDSMGLETLCRIREKAPRLPIVVLTAQQEEDYEEKALKAGAQEYLLKEEALPRLLIRVMRYAMERKQAEIELRESRERQQIILESAQAGILIVDPETHTITDVNQTALDMMNRTREEVLGCRCHHFVCPNNQGDCPVSDKGQTLERSEREMVRADGSLIPILKTVNTIQLGGRDFLLETFVDFSEAKEAREFLEAAKEKLVLEVKKRTRQLEKAKKQWEATFDAVPDLIAIIDRHHNIVRANKAMARKLGMNHKEILGRHCWELMHDNQKPPVDCPHAMLLADGNDHIAEVSEACLGGDFLVSTSPLYDGDGEVYASVHVARDISEMKKAERDMQGQLEFMNTILETIPTPIYIKNPQGFYNGCNKAFAELFGKSREDIIGHTVHDLAPGPKAADYEKRDAALFEKPGVQMYESTVDTASNGARDFIFYKAAYRHDSGELGGLVGVLMDITERKQMEDQLVRSQKMEAIGVLAAGIAHEINTPTQYIHTNVEFLEEAFGHCNDIATALARLARAVKEGGPAGEQLEAAEEVLAREDMEEFRLDTSDALGGTIEGVERITRIVDSMRYFSHPGTEEKEYLDLNDAVEHAIVVSRNEWKYYADVETDLAQNLPPVLGYAAPLNQVLLNLIINAAQAISQGLEGGSGQRGLISISTAKAGPMAEIRVSDDGPGIPPEVLPKIFDPFFTTKEIGKGTGQGLAMAHSVVVDKHSGTINVDSEPGKGSTFVVRIPISNRGSRVSADETPLVGSDAAKGVRH